jgi:glutamate carboxypeptidase
VVRTRTLRGMTTPRITSALVLAVACLGATAVHPAPRSGATALRAPERRAIAAIDAATPDALALLERTVNQNSGTMHLAGVRAVGDLFMPRFAALGMDARWVEGGAFGRAGHLVATRRGAKAKLKVVLIGHLDTVFEPDSPFQRFTRLDDSTATGPGISDMKGGDVVMLLALRGLEAAGTLDRFDLRVVLDGDEENPGLPIDLARHELTEAARGCDVALCFESGAGRRGQALVARRSSQGWSLRVSGHRAHSSKIFRPAVGFGAVYEAARILEAFRDSLAGEPHLTFNPGLILGGSSVDPLAPDGHGTAAGKANVVADTAYVSGDLRALTPAQAEHARAVMTRIVARHLPLTDATLAFSGGGYPPLAPAAAHDALLAVFDEASRDLGAGPVTASDPDDAGAGDIAFVDTLVPMALDGVGLCGSGGHSLHETGELPMLALNAKRVALTLLRLADDARARAGTPGR